MSCVADCIYALYDCMFLKLSFKKVKVCDASLGLKHKFHSSAINVLNLSSYSINQNQNERRLVYSVGVSTVHVVQMEITLSSHPHNPENTTETPLRYNAVQAV